MMRSKNWPTDIPYRYRPSSGFAPKWSRGEDLLVLVDRPGRPPRTAGSVESLMYVLEIQPVATSGQAGVITAPTEDDTEAQDLHRLPAEGVDALDALDRELRRRDEHEHVGAGVLDLADLRVDRGVGRLVRHLGDDLVDLVAPCLP